MTSTTQKTKATKCITAEKISSYRKDFPNLEEELGHVPGYDEEQESEVPKEWYEPLKD